MELLFCFVCVCICLRGPPALLYLSTSPSQPSSHRVCNRVFLSGNLRHRRKEGGFARRTIVAGFFTICDRLQRSRVMCKSPRSAATGCLGCVLTSLRLFFFLSFGQLWNHFVFAVCAAFIALLGSCAALSLSPAKKAMNNGHQQKRPRALATTGLLRKT